MESIPVTIIVKAPNQQVDDQTVRCELSWTISRLKQHLAEVYPSRPPLHEQKLIYSGQLLSDSAVLGDVLRQYDGQDTHTATSVASAAPEAEAGAATATQTVPPDVCAQYLLMQQAYLQYMTHYMNLYASAANQNVPASLQQQPTPPQPLAAANDRAAAAEPLNGERGAPPNDVRPQNAEPEEERELLDVIYAVGRVVLFSALVYYYSSPLRYLLVLFLGVCLYVYRMGFFRIVNNVNNNNIVRPGGEPAVVAAAPEAPTRLAVAWTFFTTFFASLIPEIPNVV